MSRAVLFGKLPMHGDFVTRGLGGDERDALDLWLATALAEARAELGERFEHVYDQAPPWRLAWRVADGWRAGAMAASIDAVGRRYPIVAAADGLDADAVAGMAARVEELLYEALAEGWDADRLASEVAGADGAADAVWPGDESWWTLGGGGLETMDFFPERTLAGARPAALMQAVLTMRNEMA